MPQQPRPSYEDLEKTVRAQAARIGELEALIARLAAENEELRRRLGSDSSNSSRPPSSDSPYDKPTPKQSGLRGRSGRKPGKPPGESGTTRRQVADPDERIRLEPGCCAGCGAGLTDAAVVGVQRRQVFVPPAQQNSTKRS
jgi:transposase